MQTNNLGSEPAKQSSPVDSSIIKNSEKLPKNRGQHQYIVGTADQIQTNDLQVAERKAWLYVGKVKQDTTHDALKNYMENKIPGHKFDCEKLPNKGNHSSFKVSFNFDLLNDVMKPDFWPKGILVRKYNFFRRTRIPPLET